MMMKRAESADTAPAPEAFADPEKNAVEEGEQSALPSGPMTFTEIGEWGIGHSKPDLLWVPYLAEPSEEQRSASGSLNAAGSAREQMQGLSKEEKEEAANNAYKQYVRLSKARKRARRLGQTEVQSAGWGDLPELASKMIFSQLDVRSLQSCRVVSKYWKRNIDDDVKAVIPCSPRIFYLMEKFPRVVSLDFSRCPKLRNRHLHRLLSYNVPLEELQIGHSVGGLYKHPRITNEGMDAIMSMTTLKKVTLMDCNPFTNSGIKRLHALTNLEELAFVRCERVTNKSLYFLPDLPKLHTLTVYKCTRVNPQDFLDLLKEMKALKHLHLGDLDFTMHHIQDLRTEIKCQLEELTFSGLTASSNRAATGMFTNLSHFEGLKALGMSCCGVWMHTKMAVDKLRQLSDIERLNLWSLGDFEDEELTIISDNMPSLQQLKVRLSAQVTDQGIEALARLPHLQAARLDSTSITPETQKHMSKLTSLTCVEFPNCKITEELLSAVPHMSNLRQLSFGKDLMPYRPPRGAPFGKEFMQSILGCLKLEVLDLSHSVANIAAVNTLLLRVMRRDQARGMTPVLRELCLLGCIIANDGIALMNKTYPFILCHTKLPTALDSSTWVGRSGKAPVP